MMAFDKTDAPGDRPRPAASSPLITGSRGTAGITRGVYHGCMPPLW